MSKRDWKRRRGENAGAGPKGRAQRRDADNACPRRPPYMHPREAERAVNLQLNLAVVYSDGAISACRRS